MRNYTMDHEEKMKLANDVAATYAELELALATVAAQAERLCGLYKEAVAGGVISGGLAVVEIAGFRQVIGGVGTLEANVYAAHARAVKVADEKGLQAAVPGGYATMGGTR